MKSENSFSGSVKKIFLSAYAKVLFLALSANLLVMTCARVFALSKGDFPDKVIIFSLFLLIFIFSLLILNRFGFCKKFSLFALCAFPVAAALYARTFFLDFVSLDYLNFLSQWMEFFRQNGGFSAISQSVGDYNVPYIYFLASISYLSIPDIYLIKIFSIIFDFVLAFSALKLTGSLTERRIAQFSAFIIVLFIPTVVLNSACWGQCDSIYSAFALLSLYFALKNRPNISVIMIAIAFSFKLQTIFVMPVFFVMLYSGRVKIKNLLLFPAVFFGFSLPAALLGKPFIDIFGVYISQAGQYNDRLTLNAPSVFTFAQDNYKTDPWALLGIIAAFIFVYAVFAFLFIRRNRLDNVSVFTAALLFSVAIPLLLPHMHERYFYMADVLSVVFACVLLKRFFLPVFIVTASFGGYFAYLMRRFAFDLRWGTVLLVLSVILLLYFLNLQTAPKKSDPSMP